MQPGFRTSVLRMIELLAQADLSSDALLYKGRIEEGFGLELTAEALEEAYRRSNQPGFIEDAVRGLLDELERAQELPTRRERRPLFVPYAC